MLRILVPPSGTAATFTLVKGEPLVFSYQDCNSAGVPYSLANRQLYWATYVASTNTEIEYYKATIGLNDKGDIALFALPGTHSMSLYDKYGSAPINADLFEALDDGNDPILQATLTINNGPPRIVDVNTAPIARHIQNVTRRNDPETLDKPKFEVALAAYVPAGATAPMPNPAINLGTLGLSVAAATVRTPYSATITGATSASTLSATGLPAGLTLNSSARTITGTPTTAGTANFTVVETLAGATNSPKINGVTLTIAAAPVVAPTLGTLALNSTSGQVGTAFNATITGATSGSTLSSSNLPAGLTLNSSARTISGTPTATASSFTLIETLSGATGSPKSNTIALTISAATTTPTPMPNPPPSSVWSLDRTDFTFDALNWTWDRIDGSGVVPPTVQPITLALSAAQSVAEGTPATVSAITLALSAAQSVAEGTPETTTPVSAITLALSNAQAVAEGNPSPTITLALSGAQAVAEGT